MEQAAQELQDFIASQLPCAEITREQNTLVVAYGAHPGNCTYRGQTYSGTHAITVERITGKETALPAESRARLFADVLQEARACAERLGEPEPGTVRKDTERFGELQFFNVV